MIKVYLLRKAQNNYEVTIPYKSVKVRLAFTDGNVHNGVPARLYTNNEFKQKAIEASQLFKNQEIVLEKTIAEAEDSVAKKPEAEPTGEKLEPVAKKPEAEPVSKKPEAQEPTGEKLEFASLADAIVYVAQTFNEQATTEKEVRKILAEHGKKATIHK